MASADGYENDDTKANAKPLPTDGTTRSHNFSKQGDVDWMSFAAVEGTTYTLKTSGLGAIADTYLYLYGKDGTTLLG